VSRNIPETLSIEGASMVSIPSRFRGRAGREAAAFYLSELAQGFLAGEFQVVTGHDSLRVQPGDPVVLEIAVTRKHRVDHLSVHIRWPHRQPEGSGLPDGDRKSPSARTTTAGHPQFTPPSSRRNPQGGGSQSDADYE
jgi:amphi-Trp domain-containing protein